MQFHSCLILAALIFSSCSSDNSQEVSSAAPLVSDAKQILLMGTFHYHNPGADVAQTKSFDIMSESAQEELEVLSDKIVEFGPNQIFVEWKFDEQEALDSLYTLYLAGTYFDNPELSDFYRKNEIFQLAFRAGKKLGLKQLIAVDYPYTDFPYEKMMESINNADQSELEQSLSGLIEKFTNGFDDLINTGASLEEIYAHLNSEELRQLDMSFYTNLATQAGEVDDFIGAELASEWFKRNLYTWSLIQKNTLPSDDRVMILLGSGHVNMINLLLTGNKEWTPVELSEI
jgi:hypothetical protein